MHADYIIDQNFSDITFSENDIKYKEYENCTFTNCDFTTCFFVAVAFGFALALLFDCFALCLLLGTCSLAWLWLVSSERWATSLPDLCNG